MEKIAIIGAGISGLSTAHFLKNKYQIKIFEKDLKPGGLIKCKQVNGSLFHICGGHVFNSKREDVLDWFWSKFNRTLEFTKADRNAVVYMENGDKIPYPIENHIYLLDERTQKSFYEDLKEIDREKGLDARFTDYDSFGDFLRWRFGKTLYDLYFQPYNEKVWRCNLSTIPMSWMEGKLPMPTTQEMRDNNAKRVEEKQFVHSTFWYEKTNGSQHIADKLAEGFDIQYNSRIAEIVFDGKNWIIQGESFGKIVFCGNIKDMINMIKGVNVDEFKPAINSLDYHGTTSVFCEIDKNPYSWIYQPSRSHKSHRIICTGNFSESNNAADIMCRNKITATVEFTDEINKDEILENLNQMPFNPIYIDHQYNQYTYPIQDSNTRNMIQTLKAKLAPVKFYFTGRFADWEYYNMDVAIGAAKDMVKKNF